MNSVEKEAKEGTSPVNLFFNCPGGLNVGSFPIILKFDSLGQYLKKIKLMFSIHRYYHWLTIIFFKKSLNYSNTRKLLIGYSGGKNIPKIKPNVLDTSFSINLNKLTKTLVQLLSLNINILFVDISQNYNYIPISQNDILSRSKKNIKKLIKFFNIGAIFFLNIGEKKFLLKKFSNLGIVSISSNPICKNTLFDFTVNIVNNPLHHYIIYLYTINILLKFKK